MRLLTNTRQLTLPDLKDILSYQHQGVIKRFCYDFSCSDSRIQEDFNDLLAWLWLSVKRHQAGDKTFLFGPLKRLDDLWHVFILHTRDYIDFCHHFFGEYIHHEVEPPGEEYQLNEPDLEEFLSDAYDCLGEAWVMKWFSSPEVHEHNPA